jgi:hypothetical protein
VDLSLAALLGEGLYNFAQLLNHPIAGALAGSPFAWLHELLEAFNAGDMHKWVPAAAPQRTPVWLAHWPRANAGTRRLRSVGDYMDAVQCPSVDVRGRCRCPPGGAAGTMSCVARTPPS